MENEVKTKRKLRINAFDILIILLVIACIAGMVVRYTVIRDFGASANLSPYYIEFKSDSVSYSATEAFNATVDDADKHAWVYFSDGITKVGELTVVDTVPEAVVHVKGGEGNLTVSAQYRDVVNDKEYITYNVSGKIVCEGMMSPETGVFLLNGETKIAPGSVLQVQTKYGDFTLEVVKIEQSLAES